MSAWQWIVLPALCAWVAALETDAVHVGQWMLSRPIVLGPLLGAACGAPALGVSGGVLLELFCVDVLPVGAAMPLNGAVAVGAFLLLAAGPDAVPPSAAFPAALLLGSLFRRVEARVRASRAGLTRRAEAALEAGTDAAMGTLLARGVGAHAAATAVFLYVAVSALGPALGWSWTAAPERLRRGFDLAFQVAPWLALSALLYSLRPKEWRTAWARFWR